MAFYAFMLLSSLDKLKPNIVIPLMSKYRISNSFVTEYKFGLLNNKNTR